MKETKSAEHNCIDRVRKELIDESGGKVKWVRFDLSTIVDASNTKNKQKKTGQRISYGYMHTKKDGSEIEKQETSFVTHTHCPFCGKKYK